MSKRHKDHRREAMIRELWAAGKDPVEIQDIVAEGDPDRGIEPCDRRTVRTSIAKLRRASLLADAENLPYAKTQLRAIFRKNMSRAVSMYVKAMNGVPIGVDADGRVVNRPNLAAVGRAIELINQTGVKLGQVDGLMSRLEIDLGVEIDVNLGAKVDLDALDPEDIDAYERLLTKMVVGRAARAASEADAIDVESSDVPQAALPDPAAESA